MKSYLIKTLKSVADKAGVTLLRHSQYHELLNERDALLNIYVSSLQPSKRKGVAGVLFSMNRPIQLYATLDSYFKYMKNPAYIYVMYATNNKKYDAAYGEVIEAFKDKPVTFIRETHFRQNLLELLQALKEDGIFFIVDDIIFTREFNMAKLENFDPLQEVVSLRLAPYYTRSYTMGVDQLPPSHLKESAEYPEMLEWEWGHEESSNEWAYPLSVDVHLFDRREIAAMTESLQFKAPNTYEGALMHYYSAVKNRKGLCYKEQFLFNNPCNKVQTENENIAGDITPEFLLEQWEKGLKIDIDAFHHIRTSGPHEEQPFNFVKR